VLVVDHDGAQARALDDGRVVAVERDAHAQGAGAVQELARERDGERELLVCSCRARRVRQPVLVALSWPRIAPAGYFALWMFT
jgi:hypothetical protein